MRAQGLRRQSVGVHGSFKLAGDWARIGGYRFRLGPVNPRSGLVHTERLDPSGSVISPVPADGVGLIPDTSDELEPGRWAAATGRHNKWLGAGAVRAACACARPGRAL